MCEHDASSTCERCEAELRDRARAEREADRAQEAWERALRDWERTTTELEGAQAHHAALLRQADGLDAQEQQRAAAEAAEQEAVRARAAQNRWQEALSAAQKEAGRQARRNLVLRLIAVAATLDLLTADWAAAWFVALAFAGGAALAAGRLLLALPRHRRQRQVIAATGAPFAPDRPVRGPATAALWVLVQLPAVGVVASAFALLADQSNAFHLYADDQALVLVSGLFHLALIGPTGFRRIRVEKPFGVLPEDWTAINAAYNRSSRSNPYPGFDLAGELMARFRAKPYVNPEQPASQKARFTRDIARGHAERVTRLTSDLESLAAAAHLTPLAHSGMDTLREQELSKRRKDAAERAVLLAQARSQAAAVRRERGRPLLDAIASAMPGRAVTGSLGEWSDGPWYEALPESEEGGFTSRLDLLREGRTPLTNRNGTAGLPDGPHPTAEITDTRGERILLVAVSGERVHLGVRCAACGRHTISRSAVTDIPSLLAATHSMQHRCEPGTETPPARSPYAEA
ncbi:hypothetical protein WN71_032540 [Streptomyces mangrovisoli]|uniref:Uncharacterized protein n=1 Tax=Streptomyces mangrovisoli TaxID=1428628 RepID=A0A1J4NN52_9ACTN|nr:hypothetical protein WN71_032540 [Streptomyces mangrovisoli]